MIIKLFDAEAAMDLAFALSADSTAPPLPVLAERTVVATGGTWQPRGWVVDLRLSVTPVAVLGLDTAPDEPAPSSRAWARIAQTLAHSNGWQHRNWAAVRIGAQSMVLVAEASQPPHPAGLHTATAAINHWQTFTGRTQPWTVHPGAGAPPVGERLRILDARIDRWQRLAILVPRVPDLGQLRFTPHTVATDPQARWARHPGPDILYVAHHPGGYVRFLLDTGDGQGANGESLDLHLIDGTTRVVVGPWFGSPDLVAQYAPTADIHTESVVLHADADDWRTGLGGRSGCLTRSSAQHALRVAAHHERHATALARAFHPPGLPAGTNAMPQATGLPTQPPGLARRAR